MYAKFPLFQGHLDLARRYWKEAASLGDIAVDATCGNGHDTLSLCQLVLQKGRGSVYALDIQDKAVQETVKLLADALDKELLQQVRVLHSCHTAFPEELSAKSVKLIVYNLGYLPGGNKGITTTVENTLKSIKAAQALLAPGGLISITCYPGHAEGAKEEQAIFAFAAGLDPMQWSCCHHRWLNRKNAPSLLLLQKTLECESFLKDEG